MKIILKLGLLYVALFTFAGCDNSPKLKEVDDLKVQEVTQKSTKSQEVANINLFPNNKNMIFIFHANSEYDKQLSDDMKNDKALQNGIKNFSLYKIPISNTHTYTILHNKEKITTSPSLLRDIYGVTGTPTLIFLDKNGTSILTVPGYMPPNQFVATMNFVNSDIHQGINRKNGDIYRELKKFYIKNNIPIK